MRVGLLTEAWQEFKVIQESKYDDQKQWFIEGITLQGEMKNANNRIYPIDVLSEAVENHLKDFPIDRGRALGELGHPDKNFHIINYDRVSHKFVDVQQQGNNFYTKAQLLETSAGQIASNLLNGGVKLGISSRGFGPVEKRNGVDVVKKLKLISLGDLEHNNSAPDAIMTAIRERKEWVWENGALMERDLSEFIDETNSLIDKATIRQLEESYNCIQERYFNLITNQPKTEFKTWKEILAEKNMIRESESSDEIKEDFEQALYRLFRN